MKEVVDKLHAENQELRKELESYKKQVKQVNAGAQALDQSYHNAIRELQGFKTQFILKTEELNETNAKLKELENKLDEALSSKVNKVLSNKPSEALAQVKAVN